MELHDQDSCLQGFWKDGACVCDQGYVSELSDSVLHPLYCDLLASTKMEETFDPRSILPQVSMAVSNILMIVIVFLQSVPSIILLL